MSADLVVANIYFDVMKGLISSPGLMTKKWFVLSGLLGSQARDIAFKLSKYRAKIIKIWDHDGIYYTFLGTTGADIA